MKRYWVYRGEVFLGAATLRDWAVELLEAQGYTFIPVSGGLR